MIEKYLDYTNLKLNIPSKEIKESIKEAIQLNCYGFCTYISNHILVDNLVKITNSNIKKVYVIGFPYGTVKEIRRDLSMVEYSNGDEFDVVIPSYFHLNKLIRAQKILNTVREKTKGKILKVIIETTLLDNERMWEAIKLVYDIGGDYIKTNTGIYKNRNRTLEEDVKLIQEYTNLNIKAAGGIKNYQEAKKLIDLGVKRIGTSSAKEIIEQEKNV